METKDTKEIIENKKRKATSKSFAELRIITFIVSDKTRDRWVWFWFQIQPNGILFPTDL